MMRLPWDRAQPDEWLPRSLRLCWGDSSSDGGGGFGGDSSGGGWGDSGGFGGATTGGGDWGSAGSADFSSFNAADAFSYADAVAGSPGGFYDTGGPGIAPGALGAEFGGAFGLSGISGQPGTNAFGAELDAGGGGWSGVGNAIASWGQSTAAGGPGAGTGAAYALSGGLFGDYPGGGGGGGGGYGGGGRSGGFTGGGFTGGSGGGSSGRGGDVSRGSSPAVTSPYADDTGPAGRGESEVSSPYADDTGPTGRGEQDTVEGAPEATPEATPTPSTFGTPPTSETTSDEPALSDAAPAGMIGGSRDAAPAHVGEGSLPSTSAFGPQSVSYDYSGSPYADMAPSQSYNEGMQALSDLTQTALSPADLSQAYQEGTQALSNLTQSALTPSPAEYQGSPYADMGPGDQPAGRDFNQAFESFSAQPGWDPGEQTAGRTGLAESTDWAANPYEPSTDVSVGRDFDQVFADVADQPDYQGSPYADMGPQTAPTTAPDFDQAFQAFDTLTGMDLAGDLATPEGDINPSSSFAMGWAPANAYEGRGTDYASGRAAQDYVTSLVSGAPLGAAAPGVLSAISAMTGISVPGLLGGATTTGGILGGLFNAPTTTQPQSPQQQAINAELVPADQVPPAPTQEAQPQAQPEAQPQEAPQATPQEAPQAQPQEAQPAQPQEAQPAAEPEAQPAQQPQTLPPSLIEMVQPDATRSETSISGGRTTDFNYTPSSTPPQARPSEAPPPGQPGQPGQPVAEPDHDEEGEPQTTAQPGRPLGAPTTRTQNTPVVSRYVIQEQQGQTRNRPVSEALHGILSEAARQAGVTVRVGSGGQVATRNRSDYRQHGGWTGSHRHDDGNAADIRLEQNGRVLNFNNPQDRVVMENFVREAARSGASGMGAGMSYMGPNTIHVGFGNTNFWRADNPGSRALRQAWGEGLQGPANRPPADIPVRTAMPILLPRRRPEDAPQTEVAQPQPPTEMPANLPPSPEATIGAPPPAPRPPADIPIDIPVQTVPPRAGRPDPMMLNRAIEAIAAQAIKGIGPQSTREQAAAKGAAGRAALMAAGVPAPMARAAMMDTATKTAIAMGYGPNYSVLGVNMWSTVQSKIAEAVDAAMQGYSPAKQGEAQGPPAPADLVAPAPGKRSEVPFGSFVIPVAGGRDVGAPPAVEPGQLPGRAEWEAPLPGGPRGADPNVLIEGPEFSPPSPPPAFQAPSINNRGIAPDEFMMQQMERDQYQQQFDPRGQRQASLLDILQNFNPISTAEARGGRSQAGNLQAPRADPGTIQGRLSEARSTIVNELQTNLGLRNTLDLIVTGEVGSQGKAAVLGFLETAMNKVAAEASREGRAATGRDLLNYLNDRSYFPDTWGKIESGKIKGGALTDDLLGALAEGSNTTKGSTGNSSATSPGSRFGGNPTNATIGKEHYGVENYGHHVGWYNALGAPDMPAVGAMPPAMPAPNPLRGLAKGGRVADDEPVVVGEEGPEVFVPDQPGTVWPHVPQPGRKPVGGNADRWPRIPAVGYPGQYGGVEREMMRQTRAAQDVVPGLMDMIDSGRLRLTPNWQRMINDPSLIALGRSRIEDRRAYSHDYPY